MNKEILLVAETVSNEKGVDKEIIFQAIEAALEMATKKRSSSDFDVKVVIDRKTGNYETFRRWEVLSDEDLAALENPALVGVAKLSLAEAQKRDANVKVGDYIEEPMESVEFGRIAAQKAKQVIVQKVREAERMQMVDEYRKKMHQVLTGIVRRTTRDNIYVDLGGNAEAVLPRGETLPHENLRIGDRLRAYLFDIQDDGKGPQLILSRTHPNMLTQLFRLEVPEIGEDIVEVKGVARDPGLRAKIAVKTNDGRIDPIGACVGMRGARVQAVSSELGGERIDIVLWDDNPAQLVINALAPAEVSSIVVDEDAHAIDVAVEEDQLSQAIGRGGQNVTLASQLTGWKLNVMTTAEMSTKHEQEAKKLIDLFCAQLGVDENIANVLIEEGFTSIEEIAYIPMQELLDIKDFDQELADAIRKRAKDAILTNALAVEQELDAAEPAADLLEMEGMDRHLAYILAKNEIVTREDLAEQSVDDLLEIDGIDDREKAAELIMIARKPWFE